MQKFRILVVDDSAFMRAIIQDLIVQDEAFEIAGTAATGKEAIAAVEQLSPDAITLDLEMPEMNGLEALRRIMEKAPLPVIMFSGISEEHTSQTISALQQGAFDFIRKPSPASPPGEIETIGLLLREKLHTALQYRSKLLASGRRLSEQEKSSGLQGPGVSGRGSRKPDLPKPRQELLGKKLPGAKPKPAAEEAKPPLRSAGAAKARQDSSASASAPASREIPAGGATQGKAESRERWSHLIAVGTSTGGPRALSELIGSLPEDLPAPVLVVQHMPPKFTASLAKRLEAGSSIEVTEAVQGERVLAGHVYIAPGGSHMELEKDGRGYHISLTQQPPTSGHRPSVDVLFRSLIPYGDLERHAVLLTGMGSDGAAGMLELRGSGAASMIAEAEETCVVYGMPRSAVENGSTESVLPLYQIAGELAKRCRSGRNRQQ